MKTAAPKWVCLQLLQDYSPARLSFSVVERIIQELAPHRPHFELFGGEPLLYPQLGDVVSLIKGIGSSLDIATSGARLPAYAQELADAGVDGVWISLDRPPRVHAQPRGKRTFEAVQRGIAALAEARSRRGAAQPQIGITFVVTPHNHHTIEETFLQALPRGPVDVISIESQSSITPAITRQLEAVRAVYIREGKRVLTKPQTTSAANKRAAFSSDFETTNDCHLRGHAPWLYAEVAASGDVTPCHTSHDLTFGNVNEQPLLQIWHGERFEAARRALKRNLCSSCNAS